MTIKEAQVDMRQAYFGGAPGMLVSGIIWLAAGITALVSTAQISVIIFFLGGMLIHPLGILLSKALKRSGQHQKDNPLSNLALESTLLLFIGLFIAYSVMQIQTQWFYPIMLLLIGGRYVLFASVYGMRIYWVVGFVLVAAGAAFLVLNPAFHLGALVGGAIEVIFSLLIFSTEKSKP